MLLYSMYNIGWERKCAIYIVHYKLKCALQAEVCYI